MHLISMSREHTYTVIKRLTGMVGGMWKKLFASLDIKPEVLYPIVLPLGKLTKVRKTDLNV